MSSISPANFRVGGRFSESDLVSVSESESVSVSVSQGEMKRFMSPSIVWGLSWTWEGISVCVCVGASVVMEGCSGFGGEVVEGVTMGFEMIKVSLSPSFRHDFCIEYSSSRVRGSDAVACWIACGGKVWLDP